MKWLLAHWLRLPLHLLGLDPLLLRCTGLPPLRSPGVTLQVASATHDHWRLAAVRHAGWLGSAALAALACLAAGAAAQQPALVLYSPALLAAAHGAAAASVQVLLGALASDARGLVGVARGGSRAAVRLLCGNIGLLLAGADTSAVDALAVLRTQVW